MENLSTMVKVQMGALAALLVGLFLPAIKYGEDSSSAYDIYSNDGSDYDKIGIDQALLVYALIAAAAAALYFAYQGAKGLALTLSAVAGGIGLAIYSMLDAMSGNGIDTEFGVYLIVLGAIIAPIAAFKASEEA